MTRIMLVDEHDIARRGLRELLAIRPRLEVAVEARTGREAIEEARRSSPDIVIVDYCLPDCNARELTQQLHRILPSTEILIYATDHSENIVLAAIEAGARGFVLKSDPADYLLAAVDALRVHRPYLSQSISQILLKPQQRRNPQTMGGGITPREREVVQLIVEGKTNKQIAYHLGISPKTVEAHRTALMTKFNLRNTAEVVRYALRNNLIAA